MILEKYLSISYMVNLINLMGRIDCDYCEQYFYYWSDYVAHQDTKHPIQNKRIRTNPQMKIDNYSQ